MNHETCNDFSIYLKRNTDNWATTDFQAPPLQSGVNKDYVTGKMSLSFTLFPIGILGTIPLYKNISYAKNKDCDSSLQYLGVNGGYNVGNDMSSNFLKFPNSNGDVNLTVFDVPPYVSGIPCGATKNSSSVFYNFCGEVDIEKSGPSFKYLKASIDSEYNPVQDGLSQGNINSLYEILDNNCCNDLINNTGDDRKQFPIKWATNLADRYFLWITTKLYMTDIFKQDDSEFRDSYNYFDSDSMAQYIEYIINTTKINKFKTKYDSITSKLRFDNLINLIKQTIILPKFVLENNKYIIYFPVYDVDVFLDANDDIISELLRQFLGEDNIENQHASLKIINSSIGDIKKDKYSIITDTTDLKTYNVIVEDEVDLQTYETLVTKFPDNNIFISGRVYKCEVVQWSPTLLYIFDKVAHVTYSDEFCKMIVDDTSGLPINCFKHTKEEVVTYCDIHKEKFIENFPSDDILYLDNLFLENTTSNKTSACLCYNTGLPPVLNYEAKREAGMCFTNACSKYKDMFGLSEKVCETHCDTVKKWIKDGTIRNRSIYFDEVEYKKICGVKPPDPDPDPDPDPKPPISKALIYTIVTLILLSTIFLIYKIF